MMKKIIRKIICMAVMMTAMPSYILADVSATDVSTLDYAVYTQAATAKAGEEVTLSVCLKNVNAIATWQADLVLPEGLTIATDTSGDPMIAISGSRTTKSRHSIAISTVSSGATRILYCSSSNKTITGTEGEVATITLKIADDMTVGDYAITLNNEVMSEANETGHKVSQVISLLKVEEKDVKGDVNNDSKADIVDVACLVRYLKGDTPDTFNESAADVNDDGSITVDDVTALSDIVLKQQ